MKMNRRNWGSVDGEPAELFSVEDKETGFLVEVSDYGATLVRVKVPDREGNILDVNFGLDKPELYKGHPAYFGAVVGRVTNRVENGKFNLGGKEYDVFVQEGSKHSLHGGKVGFNNKMWEYVGMRENGDETSLEFEYTSPDGEENYPGTLKIRVTYHISPMKLSWEFIATTDKTTIINITNHAYWNLEGLAGTVDEHTVVIHAEKYMPGDADNLVTGEVLPVKGTSLDTGTGKTLKEIFDTFGDVDNSFFVSNYSADEPRRLNPAAELRSTKSGILMKISTTEQIVHLYTGNYMEGLESFGVTCKKHSGICFETQLVSNAINLPEFARTVILKPGEKYYHKTEHVFEIN
ncbi:MAG: aldose epimerase family protein [Candidatus Hodarchaeota archaeon]